MVQINVSKLTGEKQQLFLTFTDKPVSAWGGLVLFQSYVTELGLKEVLRPLIPFQITSPNATDPVELILCFGAGVLVGSRRLAQLEWLRYDPVVRQILNVKRYPSDASFSRFFQRFNPRQIEALFPPLFRWQLQGLPVRPEGYTLDLDSTVLERYGHQEGAKKGYNPKKPGRPSHHPLLATVAEAQLIAHAWLRSGNTKSARGCREFLAETLAVLPAELNLTSIRGDAGFAEGYFLDYLETDVQKPYIMRMKWTGRLQAKSTLITQWEQIDTGIAIGEIMYQSLDWSRARRIIIVREHVPALAQSRGKMLFDDPEYLYQAFVTTLTDSGVGCWRFYRQRAEMENRIKELKWDYGINGFCLKRFFPTEAIFRFVCFFHNLLQRFQKRISLVHRQTLGTLRNSLFACGTILGRVGHKLILRLALAGKKRERFLTYLYHLFPSENPNCVAVGT